MIAKPESNLRFVIDPREHPRDRMYIGGVTIWVLLMLGFTFLCVYFNFLVGAIMGSIMSISVALYLLFQRNRCDLIEVDADNILVSKVNYAGPAIKLNRKNILEVTIEHVCRNNEAESTATLNLWDRSAGYRRRTILGLFLSVEAKVEIAENLVQFLESHDVEVDYNNNVTK